MSVISITAYVLYDKTARAMHYITDPQSVIGPSVRSDRTDGTGRSVARPRTYVNATAQMRADRRHNRVNCRLEARKM